MTDLDDRLRGEFERLSARYAGGREPDRAVLAAVRRRRRRATAGLVSTAAVAVAAAVLGTTALVAGTHPSPRPTPPATAALPPDQFVGLLPPARPATQTQYAWTFSVSTGKPVRRLAPALTVDGLSGDRRWALVGRDVANSHCVDRTSVLVSVATGEIRQPWPAGYMLTSSVIAGGVAAAIAAPPGQPPANEGNCPRLVLLTYDLSSRQLHSYPLSGPLRGARAMINVVALSGDGRWAVLDNLERPDHQKFYLVRIDPERVDTSSIPLPPPAGCRLIAFDFRPPAAVLTSDSVCGRTMRITGYDPATLRKVDQVSIPHPPGGAVTFFTAHWDRTGTEVLIEGLRDGDNTSEFRTIFTLRDGRLGPAIRTQAAFVTW